MNFLRLRAMLAQILPGLCDGARDLIECQSTEIVNNNSRLCNWITDVVIVDRYSKLGIFV